MLALELPTVSQYNIRSRWEISLTGSQPIAGRMLLNLFLSIQTNQGNHRSAVTQPAPHTRTNALYRPMLLEIYLERASKKPG
jgi:hypothetical protein